MKNPMTALLIANKRAELRWANERLSKFRPLVDVVSMQGDFPRNTLGKVLKQELSHTYLAELGNRE